MSGHREGHCPQHLLVVCVWHSGGQDTAFWNVHRGKMGTAAAHVHISLHVLPPNYTLKQQNVSKWRPSELREGRQCSSLSHGVQLQQHQRAGTKPLTLSQKSNKTPSESCLIYKTGFMLLCRKEAEPSLSVTPLLKSPSGVFQGVKHMSQHSVHDFTRAK